MIKFSHIKSKINKIILVLTSLLQLLTYASQNTSPKEGDLNMKKNIETNNDIKKEGFLKRSLETAKKAGQYVEEKVEKGYEYTKEETKSIWAKTKEYLEKFWDKLKELSKKAWDNTFGRLKSKK